MKVPETRKKDRRGGSEIYNADDADVRSMRVQKENQVKRWNLRGGWDDTLW